MPVLDTTAAAKRCGAYSSRTILWWIVVGVRVAGRRVKLRAKRIGDGGRWEIDSADLDSFIRRARRDTGEESEKSAKAAETT